MSFLIDILAGGLRTATPIGTAAIGETISERAGIVNIQLEGMMLVGAFAGVYGAQQSGSAWIGLLCAMAVGAALASLHALITIRFGGDQIVSGIALNLLALGLTSFLLPVLLGSSGEPVPGLGKVEVPVLHDIPLVGRIFFEQSAIVYVCIALLPVAMFALYRTAWGLRVQACGENPAGADAAGVRVARVRTQAVLVAGMLAGLGGGILALVGIRSFVDNMVAGRGFVALAAVIFGNWKPGRVVFAAWFFGAVDALQLRLQAQGSAIPSELLLALPYVATLVVLAGFVGRSRMPAQLSRAFTRGG